MKGSVHPELMASISNAAVNKKMSQKPHRVMRTLHESGKIKQFGSMQLISTVAKVLDPDEEV